MFLINIRSKWKRQNFSSPKVQYINSCLCQSLTGIELTQSVQMNKIGKQPKLHVHTNPDEGMLSVTGTTNGCVIQLTNEVAIIIIKNKPI